MQELIENINKELTDSGFKEVADQECIAKFEKSYQIQQPGPTVFINGQPVQRNSLNTVERKITISYCEGGIHDVKTGRIDPLLFITFLVSEDNELLFEDELSFYKEDFDKFKSILTQIIPYSYGTV